MFLPSKKSNRDHTLKKPPPPSSSSSLFFKSPPPASPSNSSVDYLGLSSPLSTPPSSPAQDATFTPDDAPSVRSSSQASVRSTPDALSVKSGRSAQEDYSEQELLEVSGEESFDSRARSPEAEEVQDQQQQLQQPTEAEEEQEPVVAGEVLQQQEPVVVVQAEEPLVVVQEEQLAVVQEEQLVVVQQEEPAVFEVLQQVEVYSVVEVEQQQEEAPALEQLIVVQQEEPAVVVQEEQLAVVQQEEPVVVLVEEPAVFEVLQQVEVFAVVEVEQQQEEAPALEQLVDVQQEESPIIIMSEEKLALFDDASAGFPQELNGTVSPQEEEFAPRPRSKAQKRLTSSPKPSDLQLARGTSFGGDGGVDDLYDQQQSSQPQSKEDSDRIKSLRGGTFQFHTGDVDGRPDNTKEYVYVPASCELGSNYTKDLLLKRWGLEEANLTLFFLAGERHPKALVTSSLAKSVNFKTVIEYAEAQVKSKADLVEKRFNKKKIKFDYMSESGQVTEEDKKNLAAGCASPAVKARMFKPDNCEDGFSSDDSDDETGDDFKNMVDNDVDDYESKGDKEYWTNRDSKETRHNLLNLTQDCNNVEAVSSKMVFERLVDMTMTIVESAAKANNWIVIDRTSKNHSPSAELVLEYALKKTTASPVVLVIDSMARLKAYAEQESGANPKVQPYEKAYNIYQDLCDLNNPQKENALLTPFDRKSSVKNRQKEETHRVLPFLRDEYNQVVTQPEVQPGMSQRYQQWESFDDWRDWATQPLPKESTRDEQLFASPDVHPKCRWSHFYKAGLFSSGTHYIILESDGMNFPRHIFGNPGYIFAHGGNKEAEKLFKVVHNGEPTILIRNSGGATQAYASLRAGLRWKRQFCSNYQTVSKDMFIEDKVANKAITSFLEVFSRDEEWAYTFGMREIEMCTECLARAPVLFDEFVVTSDLLTATQEEFLSVITTLFSDGGSSGIPELGLGLAEEYLVMNAWFRHICLFQNSVTYKRTSNFLWLFIALVAFATTVASVLYSNLNKENQLATNKGLYGESCDGFDKGINAGSTDAMQQQFCLALYEKIDDDEGWVFVTDVLSGLVIMLPILAGFLSTLLSRGAYEEKWRICQIRASEIVSEIYRFRGKVGRYKNIDALDIATAAKAGIVLKDEREKFQINVRKIWENVMLSEVGTSGALKFSEGYEASVSSTNKIKGEHLDLVRKHIRQNLVKTEKAEGKRSSAWGKFKGWFCAFQNYQKTADLERRRAMLREREAENAKKQAEVEVKRLHEMKENKKKSEAATNNRRKSTQVSDGAASWTRAAGGLNVTAPGAVVAPTAGAGDAFINLAAAAKKTTPTAADDSTADPPSPPAPTIDRKKTQRVSVLQKKVSPEEEKKAEEEFDKLKKEEEEEKKKNLSDVLMTEAAAIKGDQGEDWKKKEKLYHEVIRDKMGGLKLENATDVDSITGPISLVQYMKTRAMPLTTYYEVQTPVVDKWLWALELVAFIFTSFGALLAVFNWAQWVAITVALASAIQGWVARSGLKDKRDGMNKNLSACQNLLTWWDGLTIVEKRTLTSKTFAVELIENGMIDLHVKITGRQADSVEGADAKGEDTRGATAAAVDDDEEEEEEGN